jgi:hypothetical protein
MRTTNTIEGYHFRINSIMSEMHPTLWKFIENLKKFDESINSDYLQWIDGKEPTRVQRYVAQEKQKLSVVENYHQVTKIEYLRAVANRLA